MREGEGSDEGPGGVVEICEGPGLGMLGEGVVEAGEGSRSEWDWKELEKSLGLELTLK